jgi:transposase
VDASSVIAELRCQVAERDAGIAERDARIAALEGQVVDLKKAVDQLTALVGRNSRNSFLPPSSDGPGARKGSSREPGKRKRGGQPGHRGCSRTMLPESAVTHFIDLYPEVCESCWQPLPRKASAEPTRYQVMDIEGSVVKVSEFRRFCVLCPCGYRTSAKAAGIVPKSPFGPGLMAKVCVLTGVYNLSRREAASLLLDFFGITMAPASICAIEKRMSAAVEPTVAAIKDHVNAAPMKHTDATSWLQSGDLRSLWVVATEDASYYESLPNGRTETIRPMFGSETGILVSDRASVFSFWPMDRRQICWAHLIRKFVSFTELKNGAAEYGKTLLDATSVLFKYWKSFKAGVLDRVKFQDWMTPLRARVEATLEKAQAAAIEDLSGSCEDILKHRYALWRFVDCDGVEPTNNHAERELRRTVIWRRRCFGSQSIEGEKFVTRITTVARTARKRGVSILSFLERCYLAFVSDANAPCLLTMA